jgi:fructosamine-3-kinase
MDLPEALVDALSDELDTPVTASAAVGGGCIANACRVETDTRSYFLKWGQGDVADTFPAEAAGLDALAAADSPLVVPRVVAEQSTTDEAPAFLLMEWINSGRKGLKFWPSFGEGLAELHAHTSDAYGFDRDNFIGRLPQQNKAEKTWPRFFRARRLAPQVEMARTRDRWRSAWDAPLKKLYRRLPDLLPKHPSPAIVHGDLWSGNFMVTAIGEAALVDPAAYYGHRETDLAMTELFGGFDEAFYHAYRSASPLEPGYEERRDIYNLYHLINHLNHFGGRYASAVDATLQSFA